MDGAVSLCFARRFVINLSIATAIKLMDMRRSVRCK
jgi:hypothetical protein